MSICDQDELRLRSLVPQDKDLLLKWLSDPTVLEYYEGRDRVHDELLVQQHFYEDRDGVEGCIIQYDEESIGYLQFYKIDQAEKKK